MPVYTKKRFTTTVSTTIVNEDAPLPCAPPAAAPAPRAPPAVENKDKVLHANNRTWSSIKGWLPNLNQEENLYYPMGSKQNSKCEVGQILDIEVSGYKKWKVVVDAKFPPEEYDNLKKSNIIGPFTAEAEFPWFKYSPTYLIRVKRV
jgi:hypothetical protein